MALISLALAKAWLRVTNSAEDATIEGLIASVSSHMENEYGVIVDRVAEKIWTFDQFKSFMVLTGVPVDREGLVLTYIDPAGDEQVHAGVRATLFGKHVRLLPAIGASWPATAAGGAIITVTAAAGWVDDADVPADVVTAARLGLATWYDDRTAPFPKSACELLEAYRLRRV